MGKTVVFCLGTSVNVRAGSTPKTPTKHLLHFIHYNLNLKFKMAQTQPRQNYHAESEADVNKQINLELYASYVYHSMAFYFDRDDVALRGFYKFFKKSSDEEREHAEKLMKFQNQRGGRIVLSDIKRPERDEFGSGLEAMETALSLEKHVNQALLD